MKDIKIGLIKECSIVVTEDITAKSVGSGSLPVFSTPSMLALMEKTSLELVSDYLDEGETTVGTSANINHLAATKINDTVTCVSELIGVEGRKLIFRVSCFALDKEIGNGVHERFVVKSEKFMSKLLGE